MSGWHRCPSTRCEAMAFRTRRGLFRHLWRVHCIPPPLPVPRLLGPVDVACPRCESRDLECGETDWIRAKGFCCRSCRLGFSRLLP